MLSGILSGSKSYGAETLTEVYPADDDRGDPREVNRDYRIDNSWADEIGEFAEHILNDSPVVNGSSEDALKTMEHVYRIYQADPSWWDKWTTSC